MLYVQICGLSIDVFWTAPVKNGSNARFHNLLSLIAWNRRLFIKNCFQNKLAVIPGRLFELRFFGHDLEEQVIGSFFDFLDILRTFRCNCQKKSSMPIRMTNNKLMLIRFFSCLLKCCGSPALLQKGKRVSFSSECSWDIYLQFSLYPKLQFRVQEKWFRKWWMIFVCEAKQMTESFSLSHWELTESCCKGSKTEATLAP